MSRNILIGGGVIIVLVLIVIWVWVLFFGGANTQDVAQGDEEVFANLDFGDNLDPVVGNNNGSEEFTNDDSFASENQATSTTVDVLSDEPLKQLTTKRVAGFTEVKPNGTSTTKYVYFVEAGLGHIYKIDLETGEEVRISGTTIAGTRKAVINHSGEYVAIQSGEGANRSTVVGTLMIDEDQLSLFELEDMVQDFAVTDNNELLYTVQNQNSLHGKVHNFISGSSRILFTVPFREALVSWGANATSEHYIYPKPSSELEGFGYRASGSSIERLPISGFGLVLGGNDSYMLAGMRGPRAFSSELHQKSTGAHSSLALSVLPEKCVFGTATESLLICGRDSQSVYNTDLPDVWYKGLTSYSDDLWVLPTDGADPFVLFNVADVTGRSIDIVDLSFGTNDDLLYFKNKTDQTLWMFDRQVLLEQEITEETL